MSFVNNEDLRAAAGWQTGLVPNRSCSSGEIHSCKPSLQICCLEGTRESGTRVVFTPWNIDSMGTGGPAAGWRWNTGEECDYDRWGVNNLSTNACFMLSRWSPNCGNRYELKWKVAPSLVSDGDNHCEEVEFSLMYIARFIAFTTSVRVDRLWPLGTVTIDDPYYLWMNHQYPGAYPLPCKTITLGNCPVPTVLTGCGDPDGPEGPGEPPDDPEPCNPGCWPPCVMCPSRKNVYAVMSDNPSCCVSGAYALEWVGTGGDSFPTAGYFELPAPVGGPIDDCGVIDFLRVYCNSETQITMQLVYRRAEGTEINHLTVPINLDISCVGGHLESEPFEIPGRSGGRESLCGLGSGVGGSLRIVTI